MDITNKKVSDAFAQLIFWHPFFANIVCRQKFIADNTCPTFYVDGVNLGFNEKFANSLTVKEVTGVLVHETLHLCLMHHVRKGTRNHEVWNIACDYAINPSVIEAGLALPAGALIDPKFANKTAEDIYAILIKDPQYQSLLNGESNDPNNNGNGNGDGNPSNSNSPGNSTNSPAKNPQGCGEVRQAKDPANAEETTKVMVSQALMATKGIGELPAGLVREFEKAAKTRHDWRETLNRFLTETCASDYSFSFPNRRHLMRGIILPSMRNKTFGNILFVMDTSGSVGGREISATLAEIKSALATILNTRESISIPVLYIDAAVHGHDIIEEDSDLMKPKGGGGTNFKDLVPYMRKNGLEPDGIIFITDGYCGSDWGEEPDCPLIWLFTNNADHQPPFGEKQYIDLYS